MKTLKITTVLSAFALAGCSGGSGEEPLAATDGFLGDVPANFEATYDEATDTVTFSDGTETKVLTRQAILDGATFLGYQVTGEPIYAILGRTTSGSGEAGVGVWPAKDISGSAFSRLSETQMPTSGAANYTGEYGALIVLDATGQATRLLYGTAALSANFDASTISGVITNREDFSNPAVTYEDVTFAPTSIANGAFNGAASGGEANGSFTTTASSGFYSGLFTGSNGQEIVGGVLIPHDASGTAFTEYGAFVAE